VCVYDSVLAGTRTGRKWSTKLLMTAHFRS
jgi:hypothetical protein